MKTKGNTEKYGLNHSGRRQEQKISKGSHEVAGHHKENKEAENTLTPMDTRILDYVCIYYIIKN